MHQKSGTKWSLDSICLQPQTLDAHKIASDIYKYTCRSSFDMPGFCLLNLEDTITSVVFRQLMVAIKQEMATIHKSQRNQTLTYLSAGRFDQQESTRLHLDGGPDECFLMLGYEPSHIDSKLEIADYAKCAFDIGLSPKEFMSKHNPMFKASADILTPYITPISCFSKNNFQIFCINNSCAPYSKKNSFWQGTLHNATIINPQESKRRIINSCMIAPAPLNSCDLVSKKTIENFIYSSEVKRRGHDKLHLKDDK